MTSVGVQDLTSSALCRSPGCVNEVCGREDFCRDRQRRAANRRAPGIDELGLIVEWRELELDFDAWRALLARTARLSSSIVWAIGDLLAFGSWRFAEKYAWAIDYVGIPHTTAQNWAYVSRNVPRAVRRRELSHAHHRHVAKLADVAAKDRWLATAVEKRWTEKELNEAIADAERPPAQVTYVGPLAVPTRVAPPVRTDRPKQPPTLHPDATRTRRRRLRTDAPPDALADARVRLADLPSGDEPLVRMRGRHLDVGDRDIRSRELDLAAA